MLQLYWDETCREGFTALLNRQDDRGNYALHYTCSASSGVDTTSCLKFLLKFNVDVNIHNKFGHTPTIIACFRGN